MIKREGYNKLWGWFGLSYASFLVLPRVLMHEMPDKWQNKMADLLNEFDEAFTFSPSEFIVGAKDERGKFTKLPFWMISYRHPDSTKIKSLFFKERKADER